MYEREDASPVDGSTPGLPHDMQTDTAPHRDPLDCTDTAATPIRNMQDVLSNPCRRAILYQLQDRETPMTTTEVARRLLDRESEGDRPGGQDDADVDELRSRLLQAHVLEMEAFDLLAFDPETDAVWIPEDVTISVTPP